jgi:hypothetical protein
LAACVIGAALFAGAARANPNLSVKITLSSTGQWVVTVTDNGQPGSTLQNFGLHGFSTSATISGITTVLPNGSTSTAACVPAPSPTAGGGFSCNFTAGQVSVGQWFAAQFTVTPQPTAGGAFVFNAQDTTGTTFGTVPGPTSVGTTPTPPSTGSGGLKFCPLKPVRLTDARGKAVELKASSLLAGCGSGLTLPFKDYVWSVTGPGGSHVALSGVSSGVIHFVPERAGIYQVTVVATDATGKSEKAQESLTVDLEAPGEFIGRTVYCPLTGGVCVMPKAKGPTVTVHAPGSGSVTVIDTTAGKTMHFAAPTTRTFTVIPGDRLELVNKTNKPATLVSPATGGTSPTPPPSTSASGSLTVSDCKDVTQGQSEAVTATLTPPRAGQSLTFDWRFPGRPDVMHHWPTNNKGQATDSIGTPPPAGQASVTVSVTLDGKVIVSNDCIFHVTAP